MTVTLELPAEIEAQLKAQAGARGVSLSEYLGEVIASRARTGDPLTPGQNMSYDDWEREFEALIDGFPQQPVLPDEAISRESIYTREDEL